MPIYGADAERTATLIFVVEAEENLNLPVGLRSTLKLSLLSLGDLWPKVEIWYASSMEYLPVRIRVTQQNGDVVEQSLSETSIR